MEDFAHQPADDSGHGEVTTDGVVASHDAADDENPGIAWDAPTQAQAGLPHSFDSVRDNAPPDLLPQTYADQPPHSDHPVQENAPEGTPRMEDVGRPFQTDYPSTEGQHRAHGPTGERGVPNFGGYGGCYRCGCRAFEGNDVVCGNCGHSYSNH